MQGHIKAKRRTTSCPSVTEMLESRILFSDTFYVDDVGTNGTGTLASPYNSLQAALNNANTGPGDAIYVRAGTYRAQSMVQADKHGDATGMLTISAYAGDAAPVFKGSDLVTGWMNHSGNIWKKTGWTVNSQQMFDDGVPLQQIGRPPNPPYNPADGWDEYPDPVGTGLGDMAAGRFFYDDAADTLYVQLADNSNPNSSVMEASVRDRIFFADPTRGYIKIDGLIFEHGNASAVREQDALVTLSSNSIFEDSIARYGDFGGLSLGLNTTNVQVLNSQFLNNGALGIQGPGSTSYIVSGNTVTGNNYRNFNKQWHAGGIKITTAAYGLVEGNTVGNNNGSGIWFDFTNHATQVTTVRNNYIYSNGPEEAAIFWEASKHGKIYNNVIVNNNRRGIYVSGSDDTQIYNNTIIGQQGLSAIEVLARSGVNPTNTTIRNNIISGGTSSRDIYIGAGTNNTSNYNNIFRSGGAIFSNGSNKTFAQWQALGYDVNSTIANPTFATSTGDSYTLSSTSPSRDTGTTLGDVTADYIGTARPQGSTYDMGAYELVSTGGLIAHWAMNEGSGTAAGDSAGSNNATISGAVWSSPGKDGASSLSFDGVNDSANAGNGTGVNITGAISLGGWFYHDGTGGTGTSGVDKDTYRLTVTQNTGANSTWQFYIKDSGGGTHTITTGNVTNDAWHYVMGVYDGGFMRIYVDGVEAATAVAYSGGIGASSLNLLIGRRNNTSYYYKGKMDEVRLYDRALSGSEVAALGATIDSGRVAHYQMDENTGSTIGDSSGNGNAGTITGATWSAPGHSGTSALNFDGVNDSVNAGNGSSLNIAGAISIGGWFYHSSIGGTGTSGIDKDTYRLTATQTTGGVSQWQFYIKDANGGTHTITTGNISNDVWHHVMGVYDGSFMRIYVDGVEAATAVSYSGGIGTSAQNLLIGRRIGTSYYFSGKMDDIRIYDRALSASDVLLLASL